MSGPLCIRGAMLDMARITERHEYYFALLPRLAQWGYNTVFAHFTDDEGCAMQFARRPELATPHAFTQGEMGRWIAAAAAVGLDVVPEIESFGHTGFIYNRPKYARLAESMAKGFSGLNPLARESRAILRDLIEETANVFPSRYIHAGLDEVGFGGSADVRRALKRCEKWELFADHVNYMHELVTRAGRTMMMWGDHLLAEPRITERISKDIVICDWHYESEVYPTTLEFFTSRGFGVIASPSSNRSGEMVMPQYKTQVNLQRFARIAHELAAAPKRRDHGHVVGLLNTVWCPMRMLAGIEQFALALGGAWFTDPSADPVKVVAGFLRRQFGIRGGEDPARAILRLSSIMPPRHILRRLMDSENCPAGPLTACEADQAARLFDEAVALGETLAVRNKDVVRNGDDYEGFELASELLAWASLVALSRSSAGPAARRARLRRVLKAEGHRLVKRCQADWNRIRHEDDPGRDLDGNPGYWGGEVIPNLHRAVTRL